MKRLLIISLAILLALGVIIVPLPAQLAMAGTTIDVPTVDYPTIQSGINAASAGDTVHVAAGTYYENITLKDGVEVLGAGADLTTIDGGGNGSVVTANNVDSAAVLDGFTITGYRYYGIVNQTSSPTITNNIITTNTAKTGIYNYFSSSPMITNNTITGNSYYGINSLGSCSPTITNNIITGNTGGGICNCDSCPSTITNNIITGNTGKSAIYNYSSSPTITNNTITGSINGIFNDYSCSPTITNNIITGNSYYGIVNENSSSPTITNCTISGNSANESGGGMSNYNYSSPTVTNCILWDNGEEIHNLGGSAPVVTYCDIQGGYNGAGNILQDPGFVDPTANDYHLKLGSPCIDAGNNAAPYLPSTDFEGDPRIWPEGGVVDMGADEYCVSLVPATIDIDPDTLNLKSKGKWITCHIELPEGYDVYQIDISTVLLNGVVPAESDAKYGFVKDPESRIGDYDDDGIPDCMVKFDRSAVQAILAVGDRVDITVTGEVEGTPFEGNDIIRVK